MLSEQELNDIIKELKTVYSDVKAEAIILELQKYTNINDSFLVRNRSSFNRKYRRDIIKYEKLEDKELILNLSRNGIYDALPEGFFHENIENNNQSYNARRKHKKTEEENTRMLFAPLENEFFNQLLEIEKNERHLYDNFYDLNSDFLLHFWNLKEASSNLYILKLVKLLPHSHKIAGNVDLIALCLEKIIGEKVEIKKKFKTKDVAIKNDINVLGVNFVSELEESKVMVPFLEIIIGPINDLDKYFKSKEISDFLTIFYSYFLPLEFEFETKFKGAENQKFVLNERNSPIMGVSTII
ncbi:hypothetical protein OAT18_00060 [Tenacibaculum sp.]|nr:hypothetical protein [Tenacibaculum sp.]